MDNLEKQRLRLELDRAIYRLLGVIKILNGVEAVLNRVTDEYPITIEPATPGETQQPSSSR